MPIIEFFVSVLKTTAGVFLFFFLVGLAVAFIIGVPHLGGGLAALIGISGPFLDAIYVVLGIMAFVTVIKLIFLFKDRF